MQITSSSVALLIDEGLECRLCVTPNLEWSSACQRFRPGQWADFSDCDNLPSLGTHGNTPSYFRRSLCAQVARPDAANAATPLPSCHQNSVSGGVGESPVRDLGGRRRGGLATNSNLPERAAFGGPARHRKYDSMSMAPWKMPRISMRSSCRSK